MNMIEVLHNVPMPDFLALNVSDLQDGDYFKIPLSDIRRSKGLIERLRTTAKTFGISLITLEGEDAVEFWVKRQAIDTSLENAILGYLAGEADFVSVYTMADSLKLSADKVRKTLEKLKQDGSVIKLAQKQAGKGRPLNVYRIK